MKNVTRWICINAAIACFYVVFTIAVGSFGYSFIQIRIAEAFTILPALAPNTIIGLTIGCALANIASPFGLWDIVIGSMVTLVAGFLTSRIKNPYLAPLPPIVLNALIIPLVWLMFDSQTVYVYSVLSIFVSQSIVLYILGVPLYFFSKKHLGRYLF